MTDEESRWSKYKIVGLQQMAEQGPPLENGFNTAIYRGIFRAGGGWGDLFSSAGLDPDLPRFIATLKEEWRGHPAGNLVLQTVRTPKSVKQGTEAYIYEFAIES